MKAAFSADHAVDEIGIELVPLSRSVDQLVHCFARESFLPLWMYRQRCGSIGWGGWRCRVFFKVFDLLGGNFNVSVARCAQIKAGHGSHGFPALVTNRIAIAQNRKVGG